MGPLSVEPLSVCIGFGIAGLGRLIYWAGGRAQRKQQLLLPAAPKLMLPAPRPETVLDSDGTVWAIVPAGSKVFKVKEGAR